VTRADALKALGVRAARGVLLHGPPGCAKTTLVRAMATSINASFLALSPENVYSPLVGAAEQAVRDCFERARSVAPALVFLDELEALVSKRGGGQNSGDEVQTRVLATLLNEMDGLDTSEERGVVIVIGATNRIDMLDEALLRPGRFDNLLFVPPPRNVDEVLAVLGVHCKRMQKHSDVRLDELAKMCVGMSGARLERICKEAGMSALREDLDAKCVRWKHFLQAFAMHEEE
jgi:transitional endoplasmic reticulum ATPase